LSRRRRRGACRVAFAPPADDTLAKMANPDAFRAEMARTLSHDPYGHGSTTVCGERDRREATVGGAIVLYYVSGSVLTVTVVRMVALN
jgi:hypothetical protein